MSNANLYACLAGRFTKNPGKRRFATLLDGRHYTYADLEKASARFANVLVSLGVQPGDRVAIQVEKSIEALMLYLGTLRVGGVFLPLNTAYTGAELSYFLGDAKPRVFVCDPGKAEGLAPVAAEAETALETMGVYVQGGTGAGGADRESPGRIRELRDGGSGTR